MRQDGKNETMTDTGEIISFVFELGELVKTTLLQQGPPNHKICGGLCLQLLPQPPKTVCLLHATPLTSSEK